LSRVVDTSAWIEWLIDSPTGGEVGPKLPSRDDWIVPTIVQFELAKWLAREFDQDRADSVLTFSQTCEVASLGTRVALLAADVARDHKLSPADAIVYATAIDRSADLLTCDKHFEGLPGVEYVPKVGGEKSNGDGG
jgi:predicted nucleic acid-binding protein